jgi:gamma-butyrobetaine dioxygenase
MMAYQGYTRLPARDLVLPQTSVKNMHIETVNQTPRSLTAVWRTGEASELPFIWLRDNDPNELHPQTHERTFDLTSVELDIKPEQVELNDTEVRIRWPAKPTVSIYTHEWLWAHRPGIPREDVARIEKQSWEKAQINTLPSFDAQLCHADPKYLFRALGSLKTTGIILIQNLDDDLGAGEKFGDLIGFKRETNYGVMFEVKSKPEPNNLAYTSLALPLHTDLSNQEFVPGNQFLHCYRNEASGGGSIFADAMAIVDDFKEEHPAHYRLLCELQVPWHFVDHESDIRYHRPVIGLTPNGEFKGLTFNAHLADVPDFEPDLMYDFYAAFRTLMMSIRTARYNIEHVLKKGEMVIFDNQRILHGRASFDPSSGRRHLRGYYIEHNEVDNCIRMLDKKNN